MKPTDGLWPNVWAKMMAAIVVTAVWLGGPMVVTAQDNPEPNTAATANVEADRTAVRALGERFKTAYAAGDAAALWTMLSQPSRDHLSRELAEIKKVVERLPANRRDEAIDSLNASAREMLDLADGQAFLAWLLRRVSAEDKAKVRQVTVEAVEPTGDTATLRWSGPDDARSVVPDMPKQATRENGQWRLAIVVN